MGLTEWIFVALPFWLPMLLILVGAAIIFVPWQRKNRRARMRSTRTRTPALVTSMEFTNVSAGGGAGDVGDPIAKVVLQFTDSEGTERWVTRRVPYYRYGRLSKGSQFALYYDPEHPGSNRRIFVDFPDMFARQ